MKIRKGTIVKFFSGLFLNIILFLYIYTPSFLFFVPATTVLLPLALVLTSFIFFNKSFNVILRRKEIGILSFGLLTLILYSVAHDSFSEHSVALLNTFSINFLRIYIQVLLGSVSIHLIFKAFGRGNQENLVKSFFCLVSVQFLFNLMMLYSPEIRNYINLSLLNTSSKIASEDVVGKFYEVRGYGFASGHLFSYPLFNGFTACIALWMALKKNFLYAIIAFAAIFPILLNARIGLISIPIFCASFFFIESIHYRISFFKFRFLKFRLSFGKILSFLLSIPILLVLSKRLPDIIPEPTWIWIQDGFEQIVAILFYGDIAQSRTLNILSSSHTHLPDDFMSLFWGDSSYIFGLDYLALASDIGYIRVIYFGGLLLSFLLYGFFLCFFTMVFKKASSNFSRCVIVCGALMIFLSNYKGLVFTFENALLKAMILFCVFLVFDSDAQSPLKKSFYKAEFS